MRIPSLYAAVGYPVVPDAPPRTRRRVGQYCGGVAAPDVEILVIGAGQAGLSAGYHLQRLGLRAEHDFLIVDHAPGPGGAWQFRWPSLTLTTVNRVHDLPGMSFSEVLPPESEHARAATAVPDYFARYEQRFELRVHRPTSVRVVCDRATPGTCPTESVDGLLHAETVIGATNSHSGQPGNGHTAPDDGHAPGPELRVRGLINATGT